MWVEVVDQNGRTATLEFAVRRDTVELRFNDRLAGIADRDHLRAWLASPWSTFAYDDLLWIATEHGRIALAVEGLAEPWALPDHVTAGLRSRI